MLFFGFEHNLLDGILGAYLANGPWNKSLNFIFPTKYVVTKTLKV